MKLMQEDIGPLKKFTFIKDMPAGGVSKLNVFRLGDTLFDTGSTVAAPYLAEAMQDDPPKRIVLSHQHEDHMGGLHTLTSAWGKIPVYAPKEHVSIIQRGFKVPEYRRDFWGDAEGYQDVIAYDAGFELDLPGVSSRVIDTPGHTVGHKSFVIKSEGKTYILSGDLYLAPKLPHAWVETSVPDMIDSLNLLRSQADEFVLCPSHGGPYSDGAKRVEKLRDWYIKEQEETLKLFNSIPDADYNRIFIERFKFYNAIELSSEGELSRVALIRGVIDPVKELPAEPIELDPETVRVSREQLGAG